MARPVLVEDGVDRLSPWLWAGAALLALATLSLPLRPASSVFLIPLSEDGYYAMSIARNIAAGRGITIDGVTATNGFQPLFTFIQAAMFRLSSGDDALAIRLILALHWLCQIGAALFVGRIAGDAVPGGRPGLRRALASFLYFAGTYLFLFHFNGLETGLLLFLLAFAWRQVQRGRTESWGGLAGFGLLLGLVVLTRIDMAILVVCLCLRELSAFRKRGWDMAFGRAALLGLLALAISSPWWLYNWIGFGSPMPISGTAQQGWSLEAFRGGWLGWAFGTATMPWLFLGNFESRVADWLRLPIFLAMLALILRFLFAAAEDAMAGRTRGFARALFATLLLLGLWYGLSFFAVWFYSRYLAASALLGVVTLAVAAEPIAGRRPALAGLVGLVLLAPVLTLAALAWHGAGLYGTILFRDQLALVERLVPPDDVVAAGQSGTLGFFRPHVVNMDGKVNPAIHAYAGHPWDYLAERDIHWFVDWPWYVEKSLGPDPAQHGWHPRGRLANFVLYHRDSP
jgi:hypothetical protein